MLAGNPGEIPSRSLMTHPAVNGMPDVSLAAMPAEAGPQRVPIAGRLIAAYQLAKADEAAAGIELPRDDLWTNLVEANFKDLLQVLNDGDAPGLRRSGSMSPRQTRTTVSYFLSINQEAQAPMGPRTQNSVPAIVSVFPGFRRLYRMKYWIREGYVEELYGLEA